MPLKIWKNLFFLLVMTVPVLGTGCATDPYSSPYYKVSEDPPFSDQGGRAPILSARDQTYILDIDDRTPFGLYRLPRTMDLLYNRGYDQVRRERDADFAIDISFGVETHQNPQVRAWNTFGGAVTGAAVGAIIGGALGDPGPGAAAGAAGGGLLGAVLPAPTDLVRIDIQIHSFTQRHGSRMSAVVDLASVPSYDVAHVIDHQVARMLRGLPRR